MTVSFKALAIVAIFSSCFSTLATEGGMGSGGGSSIVCRDQNGEIVSAQLLDLYEAKKHLTLKKPLGDLEQEYVRYTQTVNKISGFGMPKRQEILNNLQVTMLKYANFLPYGEKLKRLHDLGKTHFVLEPGCAIEQLAIYYDKTNRLDIDSEIWDALDSLNQAALIAHEEIYRLYRKSHDVTSFETRRLVGRLFSTTPPRGQLEGIDWDNAFYCFTADKEDGSSKRSLFFVYPDPKNQKQSVIQIHSIAGRDPFGLTRIVVPLEMSLDDLETTYVGEELFRVVDNGEAKLNKTFDVEEGIFSNFKVAVTYSYGRIFSLTLKNSEAKILDRGLVSFCDQAIHWKPKAIE